MDFVENVWVREERAKAGLGAKIDPPAAVFGTREVCRICAAKDTPAQGDEGKIFFVCVRRCLHQFRAPPALVQLKPHGTRGERSLHFLGFRNEDFKRIDC